MRKNLIVALTLMALVIPTLVSAHCEIPCGIYTDKMRIEMIKEHITTIEKSMKLIVKLSEAGEKNYNQLVRWVTNKDDHANQLQHIVTQYFMTQRILLVDGSDKAAVEKYQKEIGLLHAMLVHAMKTKQTTDLKHCEKLRELVDDFYNSYFTEEEKSHKH
jgi:nickel superoxide dismutase